MRWFDSAWIIVPLILVACGGTSQDSSNSATNGSTSLTTGGTVPPPTVGDRSLVYNDEFESGTAPDSRNWGFEEGQGLRNEEQQTYRRQNAKVLKGNLVIEARRDGPNPNYVEGQDSPKNLKYRYSSASVTSAGKKVWRYGRFEFRARMDMKRGSFPAIWLFREARPGTWDPNAGEIDIMEFKSNCTDGVKQIGPCMLNNIYSPREQWTSKRTATSVLPNDWASAWHVYSLEWTPKEILIEVDGQEFLRTNIENRTNADGSKPFQSPMHVVLNYALGPVNYEADIPDNTDFPLRMEVDYVRVYQSEAERAG